jgi:chemotaxis protein methyltransferase CheR
VKPARSAREEAQRAIAALLRASPSPPATPGVGPSPVSPLLEPIPHPTDLEFLLFQKLVREHAGIVLSDAKRPLLVARLQRRLRRLGLGSFNAYYRHLTRVDPAERDEMLDCLCTNETRFFREPRQFELLEERVLPRWLEWARSGRRDRRLLVWSAGCSSGEEAYSLAMTLLRRLPPGWSVEILATDLSTRALAAAQEGTYPLARRDEIPPELFARFMRAGRGRLADRMIVGPEVPAGMVRFVRHNLCGEELPPGRPFDLIVCRNVLIYFDAETREQVVRRLLRRLAPDGLLFLGHSESLSGRGHGLRPVGPMAYVQRAASGLWTGGDP